ncbi:hypothetical protein Tco_1367643 [Tanacetum coccineum]
MEHERKHKVPKDTFTSSDTAALKEFDQKTTLFDTMTKSKSFNKSPKHRTLYHALMESILGDEDAMDKGAADELKKRKLDDAVKDEGPTAGSDRGLKRQRTSKGTETSKKTSTLKDSSKKESPTTSSKSGKSAKNKFKNQSLYLGKTDEQPNNKVVPNNDWYKKSRSDTSLNPEWNEGKLLDNGPEQRPVYNLLKGTCKSYVDLDYTMEECYRAFSEQLDWNNPEVDFFFNNDLEYLRGGSDDKKYTTSMTKSIATRYELNGIEDMVPNLWSPVKVFYDRYALLGISHWQTKRQNFYGYITKMVSKHDVYSTKRILSIISVEVDEWYIYSNLEEIVVKRADQKLYTFKEVNLSMFVRRTVIQARVEDLQLGVESYQKKLNLTKPRTQDVDISHRPTYTTLLNPQGVIYEDKLKQKRFMRADELQKFSDGTLISVRDTLDQMLHELHLGYNTTMRKRLWTRLDQRRTRIMIIAINQKLLDRRIMRSLENFVGGKDYGEDLRLL